MKPITSQAFWEQLFRDQGTSWGFEPADSAIRAKDLFIKEGVRNILIPGVGYGRNARIFLDNDIKVTGIEISGKAIELAKRHIKPKFRIHHGSVNDMPFDKKLYDGIFCYALIHLLNKHERAALIRHCFEQLRPGGWMIFTVLSKKDRMYGKGKLLSKDRYAVSKNISVYFYDKTSARQEFGNYGHVEIKEIDEPIKFMLNEPPLKCIFIQCRKAEL